MNKTTRSINAQNQGKAKESPEPFVFVIDEYPYLAKSDAFPPGNANMLFSQNQALRTKRYNMARN